MSEVKAQALVAGDVVRGVGTVADVFVCAKPFPDEVTVEVTFVDGGLLIYGYDDLVERVSCYIPSPDVL